METTLRPETGRVRWGAFALGEGMLRLARTERGLLRVSLPGEDPEAFFRWIGRRARGARIEEDAEAVRAFADEILARLGGRGGGGEVPLDLRGTDFQRAVWEEVCRIPPGATATYGEVARLVGRPEAPRAVGAAVAANPIPVLVPTHRVVAADGSTPGYGVEIEWKERLLAAERGLAVAARPSRPPGGGSAR